MKKLLLSLVALLGFTTAFAGTGTEADPYTCAEIIAKNPQSTTEAVEAGIWTKGYIVGYYQNKGFFTGGGNQNANILLSDNKSTTDVAECICIQLKSGTDVRAALNVSDNPSMIGAEVVVFGDIMKYNTLPGIKNTSNHKVLSEGSGSTTPDTPTEPETPVVPSDVYLGSTDANGLNGWTIENITVPEGLKNDIWTWKSYSGAYYLNGSAYGGTGNAEAWAISPVIEIKGEMTASFDHAAKFQTSLTTACGVAIREEGTTAWTMLTIPTWPTAGSWTFVNSGNIDLSAYAGKKVQIGFKYGSDETGADTWEIRDLKIAEAGSTTPDTPVDPVEPTVETVDNIAGFIAKASDAKPVVTINNAVTAVYQNGSYLYLKDASGWLLVYGKPAKYNNGDVIPAGITGNAALYNGAAQLSSPVADTFKAATAGTAVEPETVQCEDISADMVHQYVLLKGVTIAGSGRNFTMTDASGVEVTLYQQFNDATKYDEVVSIPTGENLDVYGFVSLYNGAAQVLAAKVVGEGSTTPDEPGIPDTPVLPEGTYVTFDFTAPSSLNTTPALEIPEVPEAGKVTLYLNDVVVDNAPVSFTIGGGTREDGNGGAIFYSSASTWSCRFYKGALMTVSAADGYALTNIVFEYEKAAQSKYLASCAFSAGAYDEASNTWTGEATQLVIDGASNILGTVAMKTMNVYFKDMSGIEDVEINNNAPVEYFNLQGVRVEEPTSGLYIRRQGNTATKVLVK